MINPNGSNIPEARTLLSSVLAGHAGYVDPDAEDTIKQALDLMTRQKPLRVARTQQRVKIDHIMVIAVKQLAADLALSNADIAERVGLPKCASGRVTEILQGLHDHLLKGSTP